MRSKTSFFNKTIFWKTVVRFWPVWGFYLAVWLVAMPMATVAGHIHSKVYAAAHVLELAATLGPVGAFSVSIVSAMAVWSFLYNTRAAHGTACLPVRRECLFLADLLAGLLPLIAANVVIVVLTGLAQLQLHAFTGSALLEWFAAVTLQLFCFYAYAVFCAMLTGSIVILPILYVVLNFLSVGAVAMLRQLMQGFLYGFTNAALNGGSYGSPLVLLLRQVKSVPVNTLQDGVWRTTDYYLTGWGALAVYAGVGVLLMVAALFLLRRRKMESAGDVVAVPVLKPVFRWCVALGCALLMGILIYGMFFGMSDYFQLEEGAGFAVTLGLLLGAFIGWFAAEMMLKKSFRVFRARGWRGWGGFGLCAAVLVALSLCLCCDALGLARRIPPAEKVEHVSLYCNGVSVSYTEPDDVAAVQELHRALIDHKQDHVNGGWYANGAGAGGILYCNIYYTMRDGREINRVYELTYDRDRPEAMADALLAQALVNRPAAIAVRKTTPVEVSLQTIVSGEITAAIPVTRAAALRGYDDTTVYLLVEHAGYARAEVDAMDEAARRQALRGAVMHSDKVVYDYEGDTPIVYEASDVIGGAPGVEYNENTAHSPISLLTGVLDADGNVLPDRCFVNYTWSFTPAELSELYRTCMVPDFADGTLGRMWVLLDDEYRSSVYDACIRIQLRLPGNDDADYGAANTIMYPATANGSGYDTVVYSTTPTVAAGRTADWLAAHGVELHTLAEREGGQ